MLVCRWRKCNCWLGGRCFNLCRNTGYTPATSGQITQNNISFGAYITVGTDGNSPLGASDTGGGTYDYFGPGAGGTGNAGMNDGNFASLGTATVVRNWVFNRSLAASFTVLLNGTALTGSPFSSTSSSTAVNQTVSIWTLHGAAGNSGFREQIDLGAYRRKHI